MKLTRSLYPGRTLVAAVCAVVIAVAAGVYGRRDIASGSGASATVAREVLSFAAVMHGRRDADIASLQKFRPGYPFWRHVFSIPDGHVVFGSAADGRRLEVIRSASMDRRESIASELEAEAGHVIHNETRGTFAAPGMRQYGALFAEWGAIYERFGVPRDIGLAQALLESGFIGTRRSEANAVGLCQWLAGNWKHLDRLAPAVIEIGNQTTQAMYCAAYLSVLATKYGSYIPALSAHHSGGTNVGRVLVNGHRLGGRDTREQYFMGSDLALSLRAIGAGDYKDIYGSYGPRSYRYAEMVFGNAPKIEETIARTAQSRVHAMRVTRGWTLDEIVRASGVSESDVRRYNPALTKQVPAGATVYLPVHVAAIGADVAFWHRDADPAYLSLLTELMAIDVAPELWDTRAFAATLRGFERRFRETGTEEGSVMAAVLAYVRGESIGPRARILATFRSSSAILDLFEKGLHEVEAAAE